MGKKAPSKHSRAARRATSPGIDVDKSLKLAKPPLSGAESRPSVLGIHQAAGVTKKSRKTGRKAILSAKARRRQERGLDRAAAVLDRTAQKVQRSQSSSRTTQMRRAAWDEVNNRLQKEVGAGAAKTQSKFGVLASQNDGSEGDSDDGFEDADSGDEAVRRFYELDDEMTEATGDAAAAAPSTTEPAAVLAASVPLPALANDDEEIL
ncbi:Ribosome biogenesis protein Alb1 [Niveomyces insectorum RCEF 264]|uniref:Ribosome biogenesis protein Alb1 n=1 Tax=Niveomyces insectorum RCEF 264 TaxID=1081102 RepID=A0A168AHH3_9HYPO|nr:Ribosome biogenesis protein Alb1 [Niveomyces insectorum RCEF 264]